MRIVSLLFTHFTIAVAISLGLAMVPILREAARWVVATLDRRQRRRESPHQAYWEGIARQVRLPRPPSLHHSTRRAD